MNINNKLPKGYFPNLILSTLLNGDKYGYEILKEIKEKSNGEVIIKQPSLYSALSRMEKQGLVSSYWQNSKIGGKRHYYSLTNLGKEQAENLDKFIPFHDNRVLKIQNFPKNLLHKPSQKLSNENEQEKNIKIKNVCESNQPEPQFHIQGQGLKNNIDSNFNSKEFNIEEELASFKSANESFSENLKHQKVYEDEYDLNKLNNQQKIFSEIKVVSDINKKDNLESLFDTKENNSDIQKTEQNLLLKKEKIQNIIQQNNEKRLQVKPKIPQSYNLIQEENENQQTQKIENCNSGIFITEKYSFDEIPKVKRINPIQIGGIVDDRTINIRKSELEYGFTEKINELYNKSKKVDEKSFIFDSTVSTPLKDLKNYYDDINIKFSTFTNSKIQNQKHESNSQNKTKNVNKFSDMKNENITLKNKACSSKDNQSCNTPQQNVEKKFNSIDFNKVNLRKSFILFLFVTIETILAYFIFKYFNLKMPYPIFYYITPVFFFLIFVFYFVLVKNNKKNYVYELRLNSVWLDLLIILISMALLYSINMLLGMTYESILQYTTTFIYPCILLLNIIINYILNLIYFKNKM